MKNIIFIETDSFDGRKLGCMGDKALSGVTTNIDKLAKKGTLFENAYSNNPICCSSRASMWSGRYTFNCHAWNNYTGLPKNADTGFSEIKKQGYNIGVFGKTDYVSGNHSERAKVSAWTRSANIHKPSYFMPESVIYDNYERRVDSYDWNVLDKSIEFLKSTESEESPFFLYVGFGMPHPKFKTSKYYYEKINSDEIELPPDDNYSHLALEYQKTVKNWSHGTDEKTKRYVRHIYYAMIAEVDEMIGEILNEVKRQNLWEETYVIFCSDHGEMCLEHNQFYKMNMFEPSVRVPLIVAGADVKKSHKISELASLVDIMPTLMDMCERNSKLTFDGKSLLPSAKGEKSKLNDVVFSEFHDSTIPTGTAMIRYDKYKYVVYPGFPSQLFDLEEDPWEITDISLSQPHIFKEMQEKMLEIVDFNSVANIVIENDKNCFRVWRHEQLLAGTYNDNMSLIFSGYDHRLAEDITKWSEEDEQKIIDWLETPTVF